ncbi:MAG: ankyrin repeat domain-containing protein [Gammaproteobacteria bacterium]|nr:ankyrin repeat domain-containing protein [Gammaproteobacteria bacterium]
MMPIENETVESILTRYSELPEFVGLDLKNINLCGNFGNTPMHVAVMRGEMSEIVALVDSGADLNIKGEYGYTPLHEAVEQNRTDLVKFLLERGASVLIKNTDGLTPFEMAEKLQYDEIVKAFGQHA